MKNDSVSLRGMLLTMACSTVAMSGLIGCGDSSRDEELGRTAHQLLSTGRGLHARQTQALRHDNPSDNISDGILDELPGDGEATKAEGTSTDGVLDDLPNVPTGTDPGDVVAGPPGETSSIAGQLGTATVRSVRGITDSAIQSAYSIDFEQFSADGQHIIDGALDYVMLAPSEEDVSSEVYRLAGKVNLEGFSVEAFEASLEMTVKETRDSVELILTGVITADGEQFQFENTIVEI